MKYARLLAEFYATPLALLPEKAEAIRRLLLAKAAGGKVKKRAARAALKARRGELALSGPEAAAAVRRPDGAQQIGRVALLPVFGVLAQRVSLLEQSSGGVSTERLGASLDSLAADKAVRCVVMVFDSPGGSVFGVQELGDKMRAMRDEKKLVGVADSMAASAAYWLLSQCAEVYVTPGGQVGSIGVLAAHEDHSKEEEGQGVKTTLVSAGKYKTEGHPFGPLDDEARAEMQRKVNAYYDSFVGSVAKGRGVSEGRVKSDFGQGRMLLAADAVAAGMADRVATLAQVLKRVGAYDAPASAAAAVPVSARLAALRARVVEAS